MGTIHNCHSTRKQEEKNVTPTAYEQSRLHHRTASEPTSGVLVVADCNWQVDADKKHSISASAWPQAHNNFNWSRRCDALKHILHV